MFLYSKYSGFYIYLSGRVFGSVGVYYEILENCDLFNLK